MRYFLLFIFVLVLLQNEIYSQTGVLSGTVSDAKTGEPLIGATVILEGTTIGSATNDDGRYFIRNIPAKSYNITVSFIGYIATTKFNIIIRSEGNIDINFNLQEILLLDELIITQIHLKNYKLHHFQFRI